MGYLQKNLVRLLCLCVAANLFFVFTLQAQSPPITFTGERMNLLSPQTYDFVKYGNTGVSHFTGETGVRIPVYTYQDPDFELPIFLGYNSTGFVPNKREGIVGLNWFLNAGGVITRKVNGVPDELSGTGTGPAATTLHGYHYGIKNNRGIKLLSPADIFNCNACYTISDAYYVHKDDCEFQLDQFTFNMPGHNGDFVIKNNRDAIYGDAQCIGNKPYYIDLSGLKTQSYAWTNVQFPSIIKITAPDGYLYEFGGNYENLEISYQLNHYGESLTYPTINAWHLTKITAPNGRTVQYRYNFSPSHGFDGPGRPPKDAAYYYLNVQKEQYGNAISGLNGDPNTYLQGIYNNGSSGITNSYEATKTVYLKSITIDKTEISFTYLPQANKFYNSTTLPGAGNLNNPTLQLTGIDVYYGKLANEVEPVSVKSFTLGYIYQGGNNGRYFLTSFQESGSGPYTFTYYKANLNNPLPDPLTSGIDFWGFWNGGTNVNGDLIPKTSLHTNGDYEFPAPCIRDPNATLCDVALLEKITYPTKGTSTFFYEPHTYSQRLERRAASNFLPALFPVTGIAGGARIRKIVDFDGKQTRNEREFSYTKNYPGTGSSGILLEWPRYLYYLKFDNGNSLIWEHLERKSNSFHINHYPGEKYIQYAEVTEKKLPANGYTNYKFTNYITNPDTTDIRKAHYLGYFLFVNNVNLYDNLVGLKLSNRAFERGMPVEVTDYAFVSGIFQPVRKKITRYTHGKNYPTSYLAAIMTSGCVAESFKLYTYPFLPVKETEITYNTDLQGFSTASTEYAYNALGLLSQQSRLNSKGEITRTKFKYPFDYIDYSGNFNYPMPEVAGLKNLRNKHICNTQVEQYNQLLNTNNTRVRVTGAQFYTFTATCTKPDKLYTLELDLPDNSFNESVLELAGALVWDKNYRLKATFQYSAGKNNLIQINRPFGTSYAYIWENNDLYPIAEAENAAAADIAYCGFEENITYSGPQNIPRGLVTGGWSGPAVSPLPPPVSTAKLGNYGWANTLSRTIQKPSIISVWAKLNPAVPLPPSIAGHQPKVTYDTNDGWKFYQWEINAPGLITINNNGAILDEVRCYPTGARISSFTYKPLVGQTSGCDFNSSITRYFYDPFNRLSYLKDDKGNILKKYEYQFAQ